MIFINPNEFIKKDEEIYLNEITISEKYDVMKVYVVPDENRTFGKSKNGQGDWYFKVHTSRMQGGERKGCARISIEPPAHYVDHGGIKLTRQERSALVEFFKDRRDGINKWKELIDTINFLVDQLYPGKEFMKIDLSEGYPPITDFNKLETCR